MIELSGNPAEVTFTIEIKRAATGLTETYEMVGHVVTEQPNSAGEDNDSQPRNIGA